MRVYRISKAAHVATALSGQGSALYPGRWNSRGVRLACTAGSVARHESNLLVNPAHARCAELTLIADEALALDPRLFE